MTADHREGEKAHPPFRHPVPLGMRKRPRGGRRGPGHPFPSTPVRPVPSNEPHSAPPPPARPPDDASAPAAAAAPCSDRPFNENRREQFITIPFKKNRSKINYSKYNGGMSALAKVFVHGFRFLLCAWDGRGCACFGPGVDPPAGYVDR